VTERVNDPLFARIRRRMLLRTHYRKVFRDDKGALRDEAKTVLADLMKLCKYNETALIVTNGVTDVPGTMAVEGMRSLVYRIVTMCRLDDSDLADAEKALRQHESNLMGNPNG
jgi:hypothetical protein